ncbi:hypothetical protein HPB50_022262 [Hyalomma asiaticum]|uniref:Uncharacterized protein n=1 Tax=Hyalomma asiaticum TaxID=266040 RepID=A0ACB7T6D6_HYAAI|nr:hypothetical protein HPB50_022262 [Hyalomma asiaticum]
MSRREHPPSADLDLSHPQPAAPTTSRGDEALRKLPLQVALLHRHENDVSPFYTSSSTSTGTSNGAARCSYGDSSTTVPSPRVVELYTRAHQRSQSLVSIVASATSFSASRYCPCQSSLKTLLVERVRTLAAMTAARYRGDGALLLTVNMATAF